MDLDKRKGIFGMARALTELRREATNLESLKDSWDLIAGSALAVVAVGILVIVLFLQSLFAGVGFTFCLAGAVVYAQRFVKL